MILVAITLILLSIIIPIIFKSNDSISENTNKVEFKFNNAFKVVMLSSTIIFVIVSLVFLFISINSDKKGELIAVIFFAFLAVLSSFLYLLAKNKKIIYCDNILYIYNIFGKQKNLNIKDIEQAIEIPTDGIKLIFKNNEKVKIDMQMSNYHKVKEILNKNNIIVKDNNGNNSPQGW